jgi:hypothetical protein
MFPEAELGVDRSLTFLPIETPARARIIPRTAKIIARCPFLSELKVPVWGTEFTLAYVEEPTPRTRFPVDDADREMFPTSASSRRLPLIHP